jgi:nitrogen fixation/metabolism regulation signal transduction histidine kinase
MFYIKKAAREKELDLGEIISNTLSLQDRASSKAGVETETAGEPFTVFMREGSCMQVFNNLFDNSIFWLSKKSESDNRRIRILFDRVNHFVYFSDNGPGVVPRYKDKIFDPFFSMKGEDGRGLGLYIVREILQEKEGDIVLVDKDDYPGLLNGASFRIFFGPQHG